MISSYQEALEYLYENLPMFQRIGPAAIKKDLANTIRLCNVLGNPHLKFKSIHVAGTNGKGSTCHMLASVMQASGYKTGLYTSPHLKEFTERIRIDGEEIPKDFVVGFVNRIIPVIEEIRPSFFEITVAMAFDYFARQHVDVAIVEVGLGGRLDSTNVITPVVSVITNISLDHTDLLGKTLVEIAREKAGIIKQGIPVVVSERQPEVESVFIEKAKEQASPIFFASDTYAVGTNADGLTLDIFNDGVTIAAGIHFPLGGFYQKRNIPGVMRTLDVVKNEFYISAASLQKGMEEIVIRTGLKGRWQKLGISPTVVCDTGHNPGGVREVLRQLASEKYDHLFIVWGMVKDKDPSPVLSLLPKEAMYFFCQAKIPRAMEAELLMHEASKYGLHGEVIRDVDEARKAALARAAAGDLVFIGGSTYVVAEIKEL